MNQRRISFIDPEDVAEGEFIDGNERGAPTDEEMAYAKFRAEMADADELSKISVYYQPQDSMGRKATSGHDFLFSCDLDEYEYDQLLARLRDQYGTGRYRIIARDGKGGYLFNRGVSVRAPDKKPESESSENSAAGMMNQFGRLMAEQQRRTEEMITRLTAGKEGAGTDSMTQMAVMISMVKEISGIFGGVAPTGKAPDVFGELEKLTRLREALKGIAGDDDGGGNGKNIHDTLGALVQQFAPMLQQGFAAQMAQQPQRRLAAPGAHPNRKPNPATPQPNGKPKMNLSGQVAILVANAKAGIKAEQMAETVYNMTPDSQLESLREFVFRPDVVDQMKKADPAVSQHLQWFEGLRDELRNLLADVDLPEAPTGDNLAVSDVPAESIDDAGNANAIDP